MRFLAAAVTALALFALVGCGTKPDLDIVAKNCGGKGAGFAFTRNELLVDAGVSADGLACVLSKVYPETADREEVTRLLHGPVERVTIGDHEVEIGDDNGAPWVRIGK
ncbi:MULTISPECIES: hypothetical protein [Bacteria]|uniref:hypothetical protein n=1 Tax=Bacteria TaxID=2 RepID=UPI003C7E8ED0